MTFIISTDSGCDLTPSFINDNGIYLFKLLALLNNEDFFDDLGASYSHKTFYDNLRNGSIPSTSQINTFTFSEQFDLWAKEGLDIIYIGLSSALTGTYQNAIIAANETKLKFPSCKISIIDTCCASGGLGLLVQHAVKLRNNSLSFDNAVAKLEDFCKRIVHVFTVDDLFHLERGGRISTTSAFMGSLLQIKPILFVNPKGQLIPFDKCRGRKKALHTLAKYYEQYSIDKDAPVLITHGDCIQDVDILIASLQELGVRNIQHSFIGSAIGSHSGANTVALFFIGESKDISKLI